MYFQYFLDWLVREDKQLFSFIQSHICAAWLDGFMMLKSQYARSCSGIQTEFLETGRYPDQKNSGISLFPYQPAEFKFPQ
jgi:hypothetical protein